MFRLLLMRKSPDLLWQLNLCMMEEILLQSCILLTFGVNIESGCVSCASDTNPHAEMNMALGFT